MLRGWTGWMACRRLMSRNSLMPWPGELLTGRWPSSSLAPSAVAAAERGGLAVADDYDLAESDRAVLAAQARSPGHLFRTKAAYTGGIDGCVDDVIAFTRPWNFDAGRIRVPVSVWYGPDDALSPRAHTDWLLQHIPDAEPTELPGGHGLDEANL